MSYDTTLLVGLEGLACQKVELAADGVPVVHLVSADERAARCPGCDQLSTCLKAKVTTKPRDLPYGGRAVRLVWHKRRWRCQNPACGRGSFTEALPVVPARSRLTARLRAQAGQAVVDRGATVEQAGRDLGLSWNVVWAAAKTHAGDVLDPAPAPVRVLGIDEIRRGRPRWHRDGAGKTVVTADRWLVGFADICGGQGLLGQVQGRTAAAVSAWLAAQPQAWRDQVEYVVIDMCAPFAAAVRRTLPHATLVVDHFHIVQLATKMVAEVRRRITWQLRGRRGRTGDPEWQVRGLLVRNKEDVPFDTWARMWNTLIDLGPPGQELLAAYLAKELLRDLLALARDPHPNRHHISQRLYEFYDFCATATAPEVHRLARTIDTWWPQIEAFITTGITNAKSEGLNRVAKLTARNAYGFTNPDNQRIRVRAATTRRGRGHLGTRRISRTHQHRRSSHAGHNRPRSTFPRHWSTPGTATTTAPSNKTTRQGNMPRPPPTASESPIDQPVPG